MHRLNPGSSRLRIESPPDIAYSVVVHLFTLQVDIYVRSQSEFYSTLTTFLNNQYQAFLQSPNMRRIESISQKMETEMNYIYTLIQKANNIILAQCKVCKKYLRDGLPPTFLNLAKQIVVHPECQGYVNYTARE